MRSVIALVGAPGTALGVQSLMYALVTPSCAQQQRVWIHVSAAVGLAIAALLAVLALREWSARAGGGSTDGDAPQQAGRFLAGVAAAVAALSCLVIVMMWSGTWILSPCSEL